MILKDSFGRTFNYLRISLTDRCNLSCFYCIPKGGIKLTDRREILTLEEIEHLVHFFAKFGITKIRFTGGEPLLRREIGTLMTNIKKSLPHPNMNIGITTNGVFLKEYIDILKGIRVNVSLDTLSEDKFETITGTKALRKIIDGIDSAIQSGLRVKINTVLLRGINDDEIFSLLQFAGERGVEIRFIEVMPFFENWFNFFIPADEILKRIAEKFEISEVEEGEDSVARAFALHPGAVRVGFISTVSKPFCNSCSRLRLTADGKIVLCMFDKFAYSIKNFIRPHFNEEELAKFIFEKVKLKPEGFIALKEKRWFIEMRKLGG